MSVENDEWEAEILADQAVKWMRRCPATGVCPGAKIFKALVALRNKNKRQECELKRVREFPDET